MKSVNYLPDGRNAFTKSHFSEQQHGCAETREIIRFRAKSHGTEKSIGVTCGQDIITAILSGFESKAFFNDAAKQMRRMAYWLRFFII